MYARKFPHPTLTTPASVSPNPSLYTGVPSMVKKSETCGNLGNSTTTGSTAPKTPPLQVFVNVHVLAGIRSLVNLVRKATVRGEHVRGGQAGGNPLVTAPHEKAQILAATTASHHETKRQGWVGGGWDNIRRGG